MEIVSVGGNIPQKLKLFIEGELEAYGYEYISDLVAQLLREWAMKVKQLET